MHPPAGQLGWSASWQRQMILLVAAPRRRVGGRHRRPGAQVHEPRQRQARPRLTARHRRSQPARRCCHAHYHRQRRFAVPLSARGQRNAGNPLPRAVVRLGVSETGCSQSCSKTRCDAPGRLRRRETIRLCMPRRDGTCETRCERRDRARAAHNPEVGGSNPPPATENCLMA
jgi:hypothetical protein